MRRFKTLNDIKCELASTYKQLKAGEITEPKARSLGYLLNIMRAVMESSDLEGRLEKLERIINDKFSSPSH